MLLFLRATLNLLWEIMLSGIVKKYITIKIANAIQVSVNTQAINNPAITNKGITIFLGSLLPLKEKVRMLLTINSPTKTNQTEIKYGWLITVTSISKLIITGKQARPAAAGAGTPEKNLEANAGGSGSSN